VISPDFFNSDEKHMQTDEMQDQTATGRSSVKQAVSWVTRVHQTALYVLNSKN